ncbi:MAG: SurA N-terminal domain-containing protein [Deltaproteobacteria bacterium]|nr:SurA N-terminal domain-containing protein [Deltaproteobacteria bacterium]
MIRRALLALCVLAAPAAAAPVGAVAPIDRPAALVGGEVLWQSQVEERLASAPQRARQGLVDEMIDEILYLRGADEAHLDVASAEIDQALEEIKRQNAIDDAKLDAELHRIGMSRAAYRVDLGRQIRLLRFFNLLRARVDVRDGDVDKEAATRGLKKPLPEADREALRDELRAARFDAIRRAWLGEKRKATRVVVVAP